MQRRATAAFCIVAPIMSGSLFSLNDAAITAGAILAIILIWWVRLSARDMGEWEVEYARVPRVVRDGNLMRITDIRNFRYGSVEHPIPDYYDASYDVDTLTSVDLICSYWAGRTIAHVFLSFGFADGRYLAVSVETRRRRGQVYSAIAGFFRHYQLIFIVADERDLIGVRTDTRREQVYLYRLQTSAEERKQLFGGYMDRAEALAERPEFYNTIFNNCTTNIVRIIDGGLPRGQRLGHNWRLLLSGYADEFAHSVGRLTTHLPFAELKARSLIIRQPGSKIGADFSTVIRETLP
jgi:hypothetical protein